MPSPTVARFVLLLAALLSAGLFVGTWLHNQTSAAEDWLARLQECESGRPVLAPGSDPLEVLLAEQRFLQCVQGAQERLAWSAVGGVALTVLVSVGILAAAPSVIRRRRGLRPAGPRLAAAADHLSAVAQDSGVRPSPRVMVGSSTVRDAFSYGMPGRYSVVLPPALAVRSTSPAFDPLVRHELAHVARHDILIAWSARSLWYAVAALLTLPIAWAIAEGDLSLLPSYSWRAALLLAAAFLASAGILRSREYDADLSSATTPPRREALRLLLESSTRRPPVGWRRLIALHPSGAERAVVLEQPARRAQPSWLDAGIAAFLAALTLPLLVSVFATVPSVARWAYVVPAALVGPLIGSTVGLSLWRLAMVETVAGGRPTLAAAARRIAAGVLVGSLLGGAASLAAVGATEILGTSSPLVLVVSSVALAGAVVVTAGLAALAADRAGRFSARSYTVLALVGPGALFTLVLWAATTFTHALELGGWNLTSRVVQDLLTRPLAAVVVVALTVFALLLLALRSSAPASWALEDDVPPMPTPPVRLASLPSLRTTLLTGLLAGVLGASSIAVFRATVGPAGDYGEQLQRVDTYVWVFAGVSAIAAVCLLVAYGSAASGAGLVAGAVASTTAGLGTVAVSVAYGGDFTPQVVDLFVRPGIALGAVVLVAASGIAVLPLPTPVSGRPVWLILSLTAVLSAGISGGTLAMRETLSPIAPTVAENGMTAGDYLTVYAPAVEVQLDAIDHTVASVTAQIEGNPAGAAAAIRAQLLPAVGAMRTQAEQVHVTDEALRQDHVLLVSGLTGLGQTFETYARALESADNAFLGQAEEQHVESVRNLEAWRAAIAAR